MPAEKVVIATTKVVNGVAFTRQALDDAAERMNGDRAIRQGLEHDPHFVPLGKTMSAEVIDLDEESVLTVVVDDTHEVSRRVHEYSRTRIVELTFPNDPRPFVIDGADTFKSALTVTVDWANFDDKESFDEFSNTTDEDGESEVSQPMFRRSLVPDPLIQFAINYPEIAAALTWVAWRGEEFLRYTIDQTLRRTGDGIAERVSEKIKKWLGVYNELRTPHEKAVTSHVIVNSEPLIHLLTRSQEVERDTEIGLESLAKQIEQHQDLIREADSVTFARTTKDDDWNFLYLTTKSGKIIAAEDCYARTLEKRDEIARTLHVRIYMEHKETREERQYETTIVITSISEDGKVQFKFGSYPPDINDWEITSISWQTRT